MKGRSMRMGRTKQITFQEAIGKIEAFFALVDSPGFFKTRDPRLFRSLRNEVIASLMRLLIWNRPQLESARGLLWPYEGLKERYAHFRELAESADDPLVRRQAHLFLALLPFPKQWYWLMKAERSWADDPELQDFLEREKQEISRKVENKPQRLFKLRHFCQVLKSPSGTDEKGVLRVFSLPYLFVGHGLLRKLSQRYVLFVEPPMGIVYRHAWWRYFTALEDPCLFGVHALEDIWFLHEQENVETVRLAHGDFLEEIEWRSTDGEREFDIVFNATFDDMERKRHDLMLELLRHPLLRTAKALFMGRGEKGNVEEFRNRIIELGLESRTEVLDNLRRTEVPQQLDRCKMGVHLSLYENACRSIYEFFRSDLPCVISSSMGGMNLDLFNSRTGLAVEDSRLPEAIAFVLNHREDFEPRRWFQECSGSLHSTRKLNEILRTCLEKWGYRWRDDIVPLGSSGAMRYVSSEDYRRFISDFQWLLECFRGLNNPQVNVSIE